MAQVVRFLVVGVANTALGLACIFVAMDLLALDYRLANAIGYAAGAVLGFLLNRRWTFAHDGDWQRSFIRWLCVVGVCWVLNIVTVILVHDRLGLSPHLAQLCGIAVYTVASFLGGRFIAFRAPAAITHREPVR